MTSATAVPANSESTASLQSVTFTYSTTTEPSLRDVTVSIPSGAVTVLAGPSAAGKSTLARLLAGFIPHQLDGTLEGSVAVLGRDPTEADAEPVTGAVGMVFDNPFDQLTGATRSVFDEVAYGLENAGVARQDIIDRVFAALSEVGLSEMFDRHPRQLSGGQSQRLAIASVLAQSKPFLIFDDPTSQLDPTGARDVTEIIERLRDSTRTVVVVAQDLGRWLKLADQLVVMDGGRVVAHGEPAQLLSRVDDFAELLLAPRHIEMWFELRHRGVPLSAEPPVELRETIRRMQTIRTSRSRNGNQL